MPDWYGGGAQEPPSFGGRLWWLKTALFYVWALVGLPLVIGLIVLYVNWRVHR